MQFQDKITGVATLLNMVVANIDPVQVLYIFTQYLQYLCVFNICVIWHGNYNFSCAGLCIN